MNFRKVSKDVGGENGNFGTDWRHNEMPELEGTLTGAKEGVGQFNKSVWTIDTPDGQSFNVWESTVLKKLLNQVTIGSYIKLVFLGKKKNSKGTGSYNDFDLFVADSTPTPAPSPVQQPTAQPTQPTLGVYDGQTNPNTQQGGDNFAQPIDKVPF